MKVYKDSNGKVVVTAAGKAVVAPSVRNKRGCTGHADVAGLTELGWDAEDIAYLQDWLWWDEEEDNTWKVSDANKAFGPNGATPITWNNMSAQRKNQDIVFFPKLSGKTSASWKYLFSGNDFIRAVPTHGWDSSAVTNMEYIFGSSDSIMCMDVSGFDVRNVTSVSAIFSQSRNIAGLDMSCWQTDSLTTMAYLFYNHVNVGDIDISGWNTSAVSDMTNALCYCLPRNVKMCGIPSGCNVSNMFANCFMSGTLDFCGNEIVSSMASSALNSGKMLLSAQSVINVLTALSLTPDAGATCPFNTSIYAGFSASDKATIDALVAAKTAAGWTITGLS